MENQSGINRNNWQEAVYKGVLLLESALGFGLAFCYVSSKHQAVYFLSQMLTGLLAPIFLVAIATVTVTYQSITTTEDSKYFRRQCSRWFQLYAMLGLLAWLAHEM